MATGAPIKYLHLATELRRGIRGGTWPPGSKPPTEVELAAPHGLSVNTVRRALEVLAAEGSVERRQGVGTFARPAPRPPGARRRIAVVLPERDRYFPPVIAGIEAAAVHTRTTIDLYTTGYADRGWDRLTHLADHLAGAEGLLITHPGPADAATPAHTRLLRKLPLPYVLLERTPSGIDDPSEHVSTDHAGGAYLALAHLAALGHRDVALACRTDSAPSHGISTGFIQGAATLGLSVAARFDWPSITGRANFEDVLAAQPLLADAALDSVLGSGATGLVCFGDMEGSALLAPPAGPGCASPATSPWSLARTGTSPPSRCRSLRSRRRSSGSAGWP